ncbi:hypothetical protein HDZ31DRAFT_40366 [Schizophyllum fasciatum]
MQSRVFDRSLRAQPAAGRPAVQKAARPAPAPAAAAPAAPTAGAGTYVRAPVPKPAKKLPPSKKPTPRKPFVRPCNPYDPMPADTLHCARCHRNYGKGDAHYFCLLPHVFDRDAFVACQTLFARQGGDRAVKAGRIKEVPCIYAACCSDAMLSAQGELYMPGRSAHADDATLEEDASHDEHSAYEYCATHDDDASSAPEHLDSDAPVPPAITRADLWLPDGNIVLEAEHTQFKFYRGLLARHSTFFRNLFDSMFPPSMDPHAEDDIELVENCPVICLADTAEDISYMLHFIVDARSFDFVPTIANLRSSLLMGHKYLIPALWNDAMRRLRHEFPSALEDYQDMAKYHERTRICVAEGESLHDLVDVVQDIGIQSVQPALLCHIVSTYSLDSIASDSSSLSPETRIALLTGRAKLKAAALRAQYTARTGRSAHCTSAQCPAGHARLQAALLCRVALSDAVAAGFEPWTERDTRLYARELCEECVLQVQMLTEETQRRTWVRLPSFFGLPEWEELEDPSVVA